MLILVGPVPILMMFLRAVPPILLLQRRLRLLGVVVQAKGRRQTEAQGGRRRRRGGECSTRDAGAGGSCAGGRAGAPTHSSGLPVRTQGRHHGLCNAVGWPVSHPPRGRAARDTNGSAVRRCAVVGRIPRSHVCAAAAGIRLRRDAVHESQTRTVWALALGAVYSVLYSVHHNIVQVQLLN